MVKNHINYDIVPITLKMSCLLMNCVLWVCDFHLLVPCFFGLFVPSLACMPNFLSRTSMCLYCFLLSLLFSIMRYLVLLFCAVRSPFTVFSFNLCWRSFWWTCGPYMPWIEAKRSNTTCRPRMQQPQMNQSMAGVCMAYVAMCILMNSNVCLLLLLCAFTCMQCINIQRLIRNHTSIL